jgi:hypothetical protein
MRGRRSINAPTVLSRRFMLVFDRRQQILSRHIASFWGPAQPLINATYSYGRTSIDQHFAVIERGVFLSRAIARVSLKLYLFCIRPKTVGNLNGF